MQATDERQVVNLDILIHITRFLNGSDLLHFMCTCRAAYLEGTKIKLAGRVTIHEKNYQEFCDYLLDDGCWRAQYLRQLSVRFNVPGFVHANSKKVAALLATVFEHTSNLRDIRLTYADRLLAADTRLPLAISNLRHVTAISISRADHLTVDMLVNMQSPFVHVHLSPPHGGWDVPYALFPQRKHLRTLRLNWARFSRADKPVTYPGLRSLGMEFACVQDLPLLAQMFPDMRHINLERLGGPVMEDGEVEETRLRHMSGYTLAYPWYRLRHVSGDVKTLYMLALAHDIRRIDVHRMELSGALIQERLVAVLREARPTHLELTIALSSSYVGRTSLAGLVPVESRITHLRLTFPTAPSIVLDADEFLDALLMLVRPMSLKYLQIDLRLPSKRADDDTYRPQDIAQVLLRSCPTIRFVSIEMRRRRAHFAVIETEYPQDSHHMEVSDSIARYVMGREWM